MNAPNASELELLLNALRNQQQCDEDGVMCIVSREAVDKAISLLTAAKGEPVAITDEMVDEGAEAMKDVHSTSYHGQCPGIGWGEARACLEAALQVAPPRQRQGQAVAYLGTCIEDATDRKLRFGLPTSATTDLVDRFAYKWEPLYASPPNAGTPPEGWDAHDATILAGPSFLETDDAKRILAGPNAGTDAAREPTDDEREKRLNEILETPLDLREALEAGKRAAKEGKPRIHPFDQQDLRFQTAEFRLMAGMWQRGYDEFNGVLGADVNGP